MKEEGRIFRLLASGLLVWFKICLWSNIKVFEVFIVSIFFMSRVWLVQLV